MRPAFFFSFAVLLLLSCTSPFLESARDPKGLSGGLRVVAVGTRIYNIFDPGSIEDHWGVMSMADVRYGSNKPVSLSFQLGGGYARGQYFPGALANPVDSLGCFCASATASAKLHIGRHGALRLNAGAFGTAP
jgi:hypothetical protein